MSQSKKATKAAPRMVRRVVYVPAEVYSALLDRLARRGMTVSSWFRAQAKKEIAK